MCFTCALNPFWWDIAQLINSDCINVNVLVRYAICVKTVVYKLTGYNQSVTGCGSQRRHVVVTQRNQRDLNPQIEFDFVEKHITLKNVWCSTKTTFNVNVSQRSQIQFED